MRASQIESPRAPHARAAALSVEKPGATTTSAGSCTFSDLTLTPLGVSGARIYGADTLTYAPARAAVSFRSVP